jgi:Ser/Thr protein kinase RdoA (MazF antagonist)
MFNHNSIQSYLDYPNLLAILNRNYPTAVDRISLHREMIGYVYIAKSKARKYVLKLYRWFDSDNALRAIDIIQYLSNHDYPVVSIVPTGSGGTHITIPTPQGQCVAVLYDYIDGVEPNIDIELMSIGQQVGRLHNLMKKFPEPLLRRGKAFYIDRFVMILRELEYNPRRVDEIETYGRELWDSLKRLPAGFCHGDLHSGNMLQPGPNIYVLFDFDVASCTCSVIDAATLCDGSNFNHFDESAYDQTLRLFERFYGGYSKESAISQVEAAAIFDFIAIRHYELIATITRCQGLDSLSTPFIDEQYDWLMKWKNLCNRKEPRFT